MTYGVIINDEDTRLKWGLILCNDLIVPMPEPRYRFVEVPERDGAIDMSETLTGKVTYSQRKITFNLFAAYDVIRGTDKPPDEKTFQELKTRFSDAYHGKSISIKFPDEPDSEFQFEGRLTVGEKSGYNSGKIPIAIMAEPYRYGASHEDELEEDTHMTRENRGISVYPSLTASDPCTLIINGNEISVPEGFSISPVPLINGENSISTPYDDHGFDILMEWRERKF